MNDTMYSIESFGLVIEEREYFNLDPIYSLTLYIWLCRCCFLHVASKSTIWAHIELKIKSHWKANIFLTMNKINPIRTT